MLGALFRVFRLLFVRKRFYRFYKALYSISLRGIGVRNFESDTLSGEQHFIAQHVSVIQGGVILDVGANIGAYSKLLRSANSIVRICAFEPHPKTYLKLTRNLAPLNVETYNVAVGSELGRLHLFDYADEDGSSHATLYQDVIESIHKGRSTKHEVPVVTLDSFVASQGIEKVALLKIDTEGHELEVLHGFLRFIRANRVALIQFEFNEMNIVSKASFRDFWELLPSYDFFRMLPDGLVPIEAYNPIHCEIYGYQNIVAKLKLNAGEG